MGHTAVQTSVEEVFWRWFPHSGVIKWLTSLGDATIGACDSDSGSRTGPAHLQVRKRGPLWQHQLPFIATAKKRFKVTDSVFLIEWMTCP